MRKNSIKNIRINSEVQRELSRIIREEVKDPRIDIMVSVTDVQVAPDLKTCKAYISVLSGEEALAATIEGLRQASGFIRHRLAQTVNLRNTPEISFLPDTSIEYGIAMTRKIEALSEAEKAEDKEEKEEDETSRNEDEDASGNDGGWQ